MVGHQFHITFLAESAVLSELLCYVSELQSFHIFTSCHLISLLQFPYIFENKERANLLSSGLLPQRTTIAMNGLGSSCTTRVPSRFQKWMIGTQVLGAVFHHYFPSYIGRKLDRK